MIFDYVILHYNIGAAAQHAYLRPEGWLAPQHSTPSPPTQIFLLRVPESNFPGDSL